MDDKVLIKFRSDHSIGFVASDGALYMVMSNNLSHYYDVASHNMIFELVWSIHIEFKFFFKKKILRPLYFRAPRLVFVLGVVL